VRYNPQAIDLVKCAMLQLLFMSARRDTPSAVRCNPQASDTVKHAVLQLLLTSVCPDCHVTRGTPCLACGLVQTSALMYCPLTRAFSERSKRQSSDVSVQVVTVQGRMMQA
jgi:hypothetical protein